MVQSLTEKYNPSTTSLPKVTADETNGAESLKSPTQRSAINSSNLLGAAMKRKSEMEQEEGYKKAKREDEIDISHLNSSAATVYRKIMSMDHIDESNADTMTEVMTLAMSFLASCDKEKFFGKPVTITIIHYFLYHRNNIFLIVDFNNFSLYRLVIETPQGTHR